jgi:hypothetical protein
LTALGAVVFASIGALPVPHRLLFALVAIGALVAIAASRLRRGLQQRDQSSAASFDAAERAQRIREQRDRSTRR